MTVFTKISACQDIKSTDLKGKNIAVLHCWVYSVHLNRVTSAHKPRE